MINTKVIRDFILMLKYSRVIICHILFHSSAKCLTVLPIYALLQSSHFTGHIIFDFRSLSINLFHNLYSGFWCEGQLAKNLNLLFQNLLPGGKKKRQNSAKKIIKNICWNRFYKSLKAEVVRPRNFFF